MSDGNINIVAGAEQLFFCSLAQGQVKSTISLALKYISLAQSKMANYVFQIVLAHGHVRFHMFVALLSNITVHGRRAMVIFRP